MNDKYLNLVNRKLYEIISEDDGLVAFKLAHGGKPAYLGRSEFDRRFQLWSESEASTPILKWIGECEALPKIGQSILLATPRQRGEFWDLWVARLLARHEDVFPMPVVAGGDWPTDYYWERNGGTRDTCLVTGNGWWASLTDIPLPPGATHSGDERGYHYIRQIGDVFVPKARISSADEAKG